MHLEDASCCPCCGTQANHPEHGEHRELLLLTVCGILFLLTLLCEEAIEARFGVRFVWAAYALPYLACGSSIIRAAGRALTRGDIFNEFTLMTLATLAAIALGEFPEAVGVMLFYRCGEFVQGRAAGNSRRSISRLLASKPSLVHVLENGRTVTRPVEEALPGQHIVVRAGERIPLDGVVLAGLSSVDQSPLTGESLPVSVREGDELLGGSINLSAVLTVEVLRPFAQSHIARILALVEHATAAKSPTERFITRFARYYTPAIVAGACLVAVIPPLFLGESWQTWLYRALVLLVISCPCALLISIPLGYFGGIGAASRRGILVKGGAVFDNLLHVDSVVFDKTGTLTQNACVVSRLAPAPGISEETLVQAAHIAESSSNHPLAIAIVQYCLDRTPSASPAPACTREKSGDSRASSAPVALTMQELPGKGTLAHRNGVRYLAGTALLLAEHGIAVPDVQSPGAVVHIARDTDYLGAFLLTTWIKTDAALAVNALAKRGVRSYMLTGDREDAARWVAEQLGLAGYRSQLLPEEKVAALPDFAHISRTAYVGDGINDAPLLALSRVGIAMGGLGAEAAIEAADAVILNDSPAKVPELLTIAQKVRRVVWQNIALALGIKGVIMIFGVAGLSGLWEAVFADVGVALLAVLNAVRGTRG